MVFDGLTNIELFDIAKKNNIALDNVIMIDEIQEFSNKDNLNLIVNLQTSGNSGSHWVCLIIRNKHWLYIDSFGAYPHFRIMKHCLKNKYKLGYSAYICQDLKSQRCGYYCLQCIKYLQNSKATNIYDIANKYVNEYEPNRKTNEKIVMKALKL